MSAAFNPKAMSASLRHNVPPQMRDAYDRIVVAGMKFMFSKESHKFVEETIQAEGDPADKIGKGVAMLMEMLVSQAKGAFPQQLIIPAGVELVLQAAEYADKIGAADASPELVAQATHVMTIALFEKAGVPEGKLMYGMNKIGAMQNGTDQPTAG